MSDLDSLLALQQASYAAAYQLAQETLGVNPIHTVAATDTLALQTQQAAIAKSQTPNETGIPDRKQKLYPEHLASTPAVLVTGIPPVRGIPSDAKLITTGKTPYYLTTDGQVISA